MPIDASLDVGNNSLTLAAPTITLEAGANITTHGGALTLTGNVHLASTASDTLSTAPALTNGGALLITGTIDGAAANTESLTLISGQGTTTVTGVIGGSKALSTLTLQQNTATSTGTVTFDAAVNVKSLATVAQAYAVAFLGGGTITSAVAFANTGGLTLGDGTGDVLVFTGGVSGGTNAVHAAGTIRTAGAAATFAATTLTAATTVDTTDSGASTTGGNIHFSSTIDGGSDLTLNAGTGGTIALDGAIGSGTRLGNLIFTNSAGVTAARAISRRLPSRRRPARARPISKARSIQTRPAE